MIIKNIWPHVKPLGKINNKCYKILNTYIYIYICMCVCVCVCVYVCMCPYLSILICICPLISIYLSNLLSISLHIYLSNDQFLSISIYLLKKLFNSISPPSIFLTYPFLTWFLFFTPLELIDVSNCRYKLKIILQFYRECRSLSVERPLSLLRLWPQDQLLHFSVSVRGHGWLRRTFQSICLQWKTLLSWTVLNNRSCFSKSLPLSLSLSLSLSQLLFQMR